MDIANLSKANEIYNSIREYEIKLHHLKSDHLTLKLELTIPTHGNTTNRQTIVIHQFEKNDATFDHTLMDLHETYTAKIEGLREEFKNL